MENAKIMRYETQIQLVSSSMKQLNKQFALVDILLCYHGNNRNMTSMSKEVIEAALPSLYGIPIVGEYIYLDDGSKDFGSHGGKIIITDKGIKFEDTSRPYGFITKDAVDNAKWVTITEKDGFTKHDYLELKGCIIWQSRYEEVSSLLDKNYGQSMEISIESQEYDNDGYCVIKDMTFSAACILGSNPDGTNVIPCFESACIGRHYELDSFKKEFSLMLDEYKKFNKEPNSNTKGEQKMDLANFTTLLSEIKAEGKEYPRYEFLSADENKIYVFDREEEYGLFAVEYANVDDELIINWDTKTEGNIAFAENTGRNETFLSTFYKEIKEEIKLQFESEYDTRLNSKVNEISRDAEFRFTELQEDYDTLKASYSLIKEKLDKFEAIEAEKAKQNHIEKVEETLERFEKKIGKSPEFLYFKAKLDNYENVDLDKLDKDLTLMSGNILMGENKKKSNFSYKPISANVGKYSTENDATGRYGNLLAGFMD